MKYSFLRLIVSCILLMPFTMAQAVDSYRYAHVTIDTPWAIFLFLLVILLIPFILMAYLHWHFAMKKPKEDDSEEKQRDS